MRDCCKTNKKAKKCRREDGKIFKLPRRFTKKRCLKKLNKISRTRSVSVKYGFTMRASCAPYKYCKSKKN